MEKYNNWKLKRTPLKLFSMCDMYISIKCNLNYSFSIINNFLALLAYPQNKSYLCKIYVVRLIQKENK